MGVPRVNHIEGQFARIDAFLACGDHDARDRRQFADALRQHAWTLMEARPQHEHSYELALVDIALITAIADFENDHTADSVNALRERLREFHGAVASANAPADFAKAA